MSIFHKLPPSSLVEISPSQIATAQVCMRKLAYYRARVKPLATPINLLFGVCLHWAVEGYLKGFLSKDEIAERFIEKLTKERNGKLVSMSKTKTFEVMEAIGGRLCSQFPAYYDNLGVKPVLIEGAFKMNLGDQVVMNLVIDFVGVLTRPVFGEDGQQLADVGDTVIIDWKTAAMPEGALFARAGFQLTYYWLAVTLACEKLGIKPPKLCGFAAGLKPNIRTEGSKSLQSATWLPIHWVDRTESDVLEAVDFAKVVARRIRNAEYHRAPHMAWNSPCDSNTGRCDFNGVCLEGTLEDLVLTGPSAGLTLAELV
ncbi:PD-(D/E)XK nuclease family protein (plasmid) [Halopseudomonas sp. SMJS2]|uniref:PD-(D/E)XK nuclease family protein n=1 Tax=Halopseudomonas sp. SMJS2 TaxID=3041098 RepID=UPI002453186F|nr:PD-(D/E)XK nuclease family protein [Halopseudomonas sp. SMJS2]WGK63376.1 PD-(D/E)XK nuclease family protein [Halopseudomonas sp. SMJS2]